LTTKIRNEQTENEERTLATSEVMNETVNDVASETVNELEVNELKVAKI
jgi:hypothetical protein